jgi:hypothetical protein
VLLVVALFVPSAGAFFAAMAAVYLAMATPEGEVAAPVPAPAQADDLLERVKAIEALAEREPEEALLQARQLAQVHQAPEFLAWVEALEHRVEQTQPPPAPVPAPVAPTPVAPAPAPVPARPAPANDVLDTRIRRPPPQPAPSGGAQ